MNRYNLPTSIEIDGVDCPIYSDYRDILQIFEILNDPDLLDIEKAMIALDYFYKDDSYNINVELAIKYMYEFMNGGEAEEKTPKNEQPLFDWEQDFSIIVAPINRTLGYDARGVEYLHWWTFLSAFMEIGECTFSTYVNIRQKYNKGKKLEKYEEQILKEHRDKIILKKKYDSSTQDMINDILGW